MKYVAFLNTVCATMMISFCDCHAASVNANFSKNESNFTATEWRNTSRTFLPSPFIKAHHLSEALQQQSQLNTSNSSVFSNVTNSSESEVPRSYLLPVIGFSATVFMTIAYVLYQCRKSHQARHFVLDQQVEILLQPQGLNDFREGAIGEARTPSDFMDFPNDSPSSSFDMLDFDLVSERRIVGDQSELLRLAEINHEEKQGSEVQNSMAILFAQRDTQRRLAVQPHWEDDPYFSLEPAAPENKRGKFGRSLAVQDIAELASPIMAKHESIQAAPTRRPLADQYLHLKSTSNP
jgi:hypothetical protein